MRASERFPRRLLAALLLLAAAPAGAQEGIAAAEDPAEPAAMATLAERDVYRREVFRYQAAGRPDPFQPLLSGDEIGVRAQDLALEGIIHSTTPGASVAIFALPGNAGRVRLRVGQRVGSVTVVAIHPRRVDVREDQFGVSRAYSMQLQRRGAEAVEGSPARPEAAPPPAPPPAAGGRP
jgi:hypothetical protein